MLSGKALSACAVFVCFFFPDLMAEQGQQALKSVKDKTLKKVIREGNLRALVNSKEGREFFDAYVRNPENPHREFAKYWDFHELVNELNGADSVSQQLELADRCFEKHIAFEADPEDRIDDLIDRSTVDKVKKDLVSCKQESKSPAPIYKALQKASFEHLDQEFFCRYLIPLLDSEKSERVSIACGLS